MKNKVKEEILNKEDTSFKTNENKFLVLHNDDHHTFDEVIEALIDVCSHKQEQAIQCTYLVHYKGRADVKKGEINFLKPMKQQLTERGLKATIE